MPDLSHFTLQPRCIAIAGFPHNYTKSGSDESPSQDGLADQTGVSDRGRNLETIQASFKSAQWSPDGTCIVTSSDDNRLRTFVIADPDDVSPTDLLDEREEPLDLKPYSTLTFPEPVYATSMYPHFNLQDPSTALLVASRRSLPVVLHSCLTSSPILASYPLISPTTEAYITPHSLLFTPPGTHFLAGSDSLISYFDISRNGSGPVSRFPTIPSKRKKLVGGGVGMKGIVSALGLRQEGDLLAAGTFTRNVGLYDANGAGNCVAVFSVAAEADQYEGAGVTQLLWSPCGRYLYVVERKSDGIIIYDIRVAGRRIGCLRGRKSETNQRLGADIISTREGREIWAGGMTGTVSVWSSAGDHEGDCGPTGQWLAHNNPVTSTIIHPSGAVVATASAQDRLSQDRSSNSSTTDNSTLLTPSGASGTTRSDGALNIWTL